MWWAYPLIQTAVSAGTQLLNKPKKHTPNLDWMNKYINQMKGQRSSNATFNTIMQGGGKQIAQNSERARLENEFDNYRYGTGGSGIDAEKNISNFQEANRAGADLTQRAGEIRSQENKYYTDKISEAEMMKEKAISEAKERYKVEKDNWNKNWIGAGIQSAGSFAAAGLQNMAGWNNAYDLAKMEDKTLTMEGFKAMGKTPEVAAQAFGISQAKMQDKSFYDSFSQLLGSNQKMDADLSLPQNIKLLETELKIAGDNQTKAAAQKMLEYRANPPQDISNAVEEIKGMIVNEEIDEQHGMKILDYVESLQPKMDDSTTKVSLNFNGNPTDFEIPTHIYQEATNKGIPLEQVVSQYGNPTKVDVLAGERQRAAEMKQQQKLIEQQTEEIKDRESAIDSLQATKTFLDTYRTPMVPEETANKMNEALANIDKTDIASFTKIAAEYSYSYKPETTGYSSFLTAENTNLQENLYNMLIKTYKNYHKFKDTTLNTTEAFNESLDELGF